MIQKITQLFTLFLFAFASINMQAQTGEWYRENFLPTAVSGDSSVITTDSSGNVYAAYRYLAQGYLYVAKFDASGNVLWNDVVEGALNNANVQVSGIEVIDNGGIDYLYVGFDSQLVTPSYDNPGVICYNTSGVMQWAFSYVQTSVQRDLSDFSVGSDGTLILTCSDLVLFLDKDGEMLGQQGTNVSLTKTDTSTANTNGSPDADTGGKFTNTETKTPFSVGSPLENTPTPTDVFNAEKSFTFGVTYSQNDPVNGQLIEAMSTDVFIAGVGLIVGVNNTFKASILNNDGFYLFTTSEIDNNGNQVITKFDKTDKTTVEWSYNWKQYSGNEGSILSDENGNIYLITWDLAYFLNSSSIDTMIVKFDKNGTLLWSKVYGNGTNSGNDLPWSSNSVDIDTTNQKIALNLYTDSFDSGTPKSAMLILNYDGELQNYTLVGEQSVSMFGFSAKFDSTGNVYGTGFANGANATIFKINSTTVFDTTLSTNPYTSVVNKLSLMVKDNGTRVSFKIDNAKTANISLYTVAGQEIYNNDVLLNNDNAEISGLNLQKGQVYLFSYKVLGVSETVKFTF